MNSPLLRSTIATLWSWCTGGIFLGFSLFLVVSAVASGQNVRLKDRTDWWSINNEGFHRGDVKTRNGHSVSGTFEIAGVALGSDQFTAIVKKLGKAPMLDCSRGESQPCWLSAVCCRCSHTKLLRNRCGHGLPFWTRGILACVRWGFC
jgi:hypothetical protein